MAAAPAAPSTSDSLATIRARALAVAELAARRCGALMRASVGKATHKAKADAKDLVTEVDKACEDAVRAAVALHFPTGHAVLGEEGVAPGSRAATEATSAAIGAAEADDSAGHGDEDGWLWVVDPIDGTVNFVAGIPCSVVSIGIAHRGTLQAAIIYEPYRDELFSATLGGGTTLNGRPVRVADCALGDAMVAYGASSKPHLQAPCFRGLAAVQRECRGTRNLGAAALHMAYVACGRLAAFWQLDLNAWDLAAGALLIAEAGGVVTDASGEPYSLATRDVLATNGNAALREALHATLRRADALTHDAAEEG